MITHELSPLISKDGLKLHLTTNQVSNPIAGVLIVHGFGEHIGRYDHVYSAFEKEKIAIYGMDLRGHGKSEGKKGHARSYELLMDDIEELMKSFRADHNDLPMFLYGHSMGGNLVANFVIRKKTNELAGFILSSPWLKLAFDPPAWQTKAAGILAKMLSSFTMNNNLNADDLSKIESVARDYETDPLVNSKISAGLYVMISKAGQFALNNKNKIELPGLLYHGDADQITSHAATKEFAEGLTQVKWISYPNVRHEGHNDSEQADIIKNCIDWVKQTI